MLYNFEPNNDYKNKRNVMLSLYLFKKHHASNQKVIGSISDEAFGFLN
jgi:hypothetical protein